MRLRLLRFLAVGLLLAGLHLPGCSGRPAGDGNAKPAAALPHPDILLGPYVTAVTDTSAKVLWVTGPGARTTSIEVSQAGPPGGAARVKVDVNEGKLPDQPEVLHTATLTGLAPGAPCSYTVSDGRGAVKGSFQTAPAPGEANAPFKFIVYGDSRTYSERHAAVAGAICKELPFAFVIHTGDLVSNGFMWEQWEGEFFGPAGDMLRQAAIWPVRGNHEGDAATYGDLFAPLPHRGLYYGFDWGGAHFAVLDSGGTWVNNDPNMMKWLDEDLSRSKAAWKFAVYHMPTIDTMNHGEGWGREDVWPILQKHGVDMVFCGHSHVYERFRPIGERGAKPIIEIVTGGGGAPTYETCSCPAVQTSYEGLHYCVVELAGPTLRFAAKSPGGAVIDRFQVSKEGNAFDANTMDRAIPTTEAWEN